MRKLRVLAAFLCAAVMTVSAAAFNVSASDESSGCSRTQTEQEAFIEQLAESCFSNTAKEAESRDILIETAGLYLKLQPQAVNLLIEKLPVFKETAEKGELSRTVGAYIYYKYGDNDMPAHYGTPGSAGNMFERFVKEDGSFGIRNLLQHDMRILIQKDAEG